MADKPDKSGKKKKHGGEGRRMGLFISLIWTLLILLLYVLPRMEGSYYRFLRLNLLDIIEAYTLNFRFQVRGPRMPTDHILIVAVDEKTHDRLGRWQSTGRAWTADFIRILTQGGARVIGFDVSFSTTGENTALQAIQSLKADYLSKTGSNADPDYLKHLQELETDLDYDARLEEALKSFGNAILGTYYLSANDARQITPEQSEANQQLISRTRYGILRYRSAIRPPLKLERGVEAELNIPRFSNAAKSFGHFNVFPDVDGNRRWVPLLMEYKGNYYPSLDLEIARFALDPNASQPIIYIRETTEGRYGEVDSILLKDILIPVDEQARLLINYYGPEGMFRYYSLADVILCERITGKPLDSRCEKEIRPENVKDKIVLLGWTGDISQDLHPTPFQAKFPGVEIHATVIENILQRDFLTRPGIAIAVDGLVILCVGFLIGFLLPRLRLVTGIALTLFCITLLAGFVYGAFIYSKVWLNFTYPFLLIAISYTSLTSYKYFSEERRKREIRNAFQHYVSPAVVDELLEDVERLKLGGERKYLTVLFSDIRGFTSMSEKLDAEKLVHFLNGYLTPMTDIVMDYKGTLDKYMGDAIMAFFGAPLPQEDHAVRACKTALDMMAKLREMRIQWKTQGYPFLDIGIGINSGEVVVGNMGSHSRFDYTIIGDQVNLASRLEGVNKLYGTNIVLSENTYKLIKDHPFVVRELDRITVKGKIEPVTIYELIGEGIPSPEVQDFIHTFEAGLKEYRNQNWDQAIFCFEKALKIKTEDKACKLFLEHCQNYKLNPPPPHWDGVHEIKEK